MRILVGVKRVVDYAVKVRVKPDSTGVDLSSVKMSMNPFCEIALEEAVRLKEAALANEVIVMSIGPKHSQDTLRVALAMGADRAIHVSTEAAHVEPRAVAGIFAHVAAHERPDLVVLGKQAIDGDCNQTGQLLAGMMDWPQATFAYKLEASAGKLNVTREVDGGLKTVGLSLPAVVTCDLRLNEPRFATMPNVMKARKKKIQTLTPNECGVDLTPRLRTLSVVEPEARPSGSILSSVDELMDKLTNEAKVI